MKAKYYKLFALFAFMFFFSVRAYSQTVYYVTGAVTLGTQTGSVTYGTGSSAIYSISIHGSNYNGMGLLATTADQLSVVWTAGGTYIGRVAAGALKITIAALVNK